MKNEPYGKERSEPSTNATVIDINRARAIACTRKDATRRRERKTPSSLARARVRGKEEARGGKKRESRKEKGVFRSFRNGQAQKERNETKRRRLIDVR